MKRFLMIWMAAFMCICAAKAVPAYKGKVKVQQPDGRTLTVQLHGDEYMCFRTTADGYTVVKDQRGYIVYAEKKEGQLVPTSRVAHDVAERTADEVAWLQSVQKYMAPVMTAKQADEQQAERSRRQKAQGERRRAYYDYGNFRGLIVLVEYSDQKFLRSDYAEVVDSMANQVDYPGYDNSRYGRFTGSVRDYFYDNSNGMFSPQFDVVGPCKVNRSKYYANKTDNVAQLTCDVLDKIDSQVDFSQYDRDGNGEVDMVYFIFAGAGAHMSGDDDCKLLWPHASSIYNPSGGSRNWQVVKDGVRLGRYACSVELYGQENSTILDGIGTICHEFSHVLGLPDLYDTDYEKNGQSPTPDDWSVMSGGSYLNFSRTPCGYTVYERYALGFAYPQTLTEEGSYSLGSIGSTNEGFRLDTPVKKEFFLIENRQQEDKWDQYLPNHGMLVFRVDSTNSFVWSNNTVNNNPNHLYFELVRAGGTTRNANYDPFPGYGRVRSLNNVTSPANLLTWAGKETQMGLKNIQEDNGIITFDLENTFVLAKLELPETFMAGLGISRQLKAVATPEYAVFKLTWTSADEHIAKVTQEGMVTGISIGETTITVTSDNGLSATCRVRVTELPVASTVSEFKAMAADSESLLTLTNAQVLYASGSDYYVRDATGAIIFSSTGISLKRNDVINGQVYGKLSSREKMPLFLGVEGMTSDTDLTIAAGETAKPRSVQLKDLTAADYADYVVIDSVQLLRDGGVYAFEGDARARLWNKFNVKNLKVPTSIDNLLFRVVGIYGTDAFDDEVIDEIYLLESPKKVGETVVDAVRDVRVADDSEAPLYNLQGQRVSGDAKGLLIRGGRKILHR